MPGDNQPVILRNFADLLKHGYKLCGYCRACGVHRDIDLAHCPAAQSYIGSRFRCRDCGSSAEITLSQIKISNDSHSPTLDKWRSR